MKRTLILTVIALGLTASSLLAQQEPADGTDGNDSLSDQVTRQASKLEAELGKYRDTSSQAAEALVQLVDLYHAHGRVFGLIRAGEKFAAAHPADRRHPGVMLKLIDGLQATSRSKEMVAASRQFLARYPGAPECAAIEVRLADTLIRLGDKTRTADACRNVWKRQQGNPVGRKYGALAVRTYSQLGSPTSIEKAAQLAEEMLDKLPRGLFAKYLGYQGFLEWQRIDQRAKSNVVGNKLLGKGITDDKQLTLQLYLAMADNYSRLQQYSNAVDILGKARRLGDNAGLHRQQIERLHSANAKGKEMEPLVREYLSKYRDRDDRHRMESYLAQAYLRTDAQGVAEDKPKALQILSRLLSVDAVTNSNAQTFVRNNGYEPAQLAATERALRDAIGKNARDANYLRYALAYWVYRDQMKDNDKCRAVLRDLVSRSPSNDGNTSGAVEWLLDNAPNDNEFRSDVTRVIASRRENLHMPYFRDSLKNWQQKAKGREGFADKARVVAELLKKADGDPIVSLWLKVADQTGPNEAADREKLIEPGVLGKLNSNMAYYILWKQSEYYRTRNTLDGRVEGARVAGLMAKRSRNDYLLATRYLQLATDAGLPDVSVDAANHMLRLEPEPNGSDIWRRLLIAADRKEDDALAKRAHAWIVKATDRFGKDAGQAPYIGDTLEKRGMPQEALAYWKTYATNEPRRTEARDCATRLIERMEGDERTRFIRDLVKYDTDYHGQYAQLLAQDYFQAGDLNNFERTLREMKKRQDERPLRGSGFNEDTAKGWVETYRNNEDASEADKRRVATVIRELGEWECSAAARLVLLEITPLDAMPPIERLLAYQETTRMVRDDSNGWDRMMPYAQAALGRNDYLSAATLLTGMLTNISRADDRRKTTGREMVAQSYSRMGSVGLTIDDTSPIAPLLRAALYLRLGDGRLAFDTYAANKELFDRHRSEVPVDLVIFVCQKLTAAGGDENHDRVEDILRGWMVKHSESQQFEDATKAQIQLLLAKNYYKAQRYEVARSEFTTVVNRYRDTDEAVEAEFGIGETFMAQRVFDQAEAVFEKLATRRTAEIVVRAEFLRGMLALRRGDHREARDIFLGVLDRVPDVDLANQALFSLSEVYGAQQRYLDQLQLLRTVGRLGHTSKRNHAPGVPLSIVVHDTDLGISRGHNRIPVTVSTTPGGDIEQVFLTSSGAGRGLFRVDLETRLGNAVPNDNVLQLTGLDVIRCDYPDEFKTQFRSVPLSDVDIHIAADGELKIASGRIVDLEEETFSERLQRELEEKQEADQRRSQGRPANQIKPGNPFYIRVHDADRDLSNEADELVVKVTANSGDQVQGVLKETGPHTGLFEAVIATAELPAGALATDSAIDHGPLKAIDRDPKTFWQSEPDGETPKMLTIDMKGLQNISRVKISTPDPTANSPVRGVVQGSHDGEFWFHLAGNPAMPMAEPVAGESGRMTRRVYTGRRADYTDWNKVVELTKSGQADHEETVDDLSWTPPEDEDGKQKASAVVWHGKLVQLSDGAARIAVRGKYTAIAIDGRLQLGLGEGGRSVDVWLLRGTHDLTIFAAGSAGQEVGATLARANLTSAAVTLRPFAASDFDFDETVADAAASEPPAAEANDSPEDSDAETTETTEDAGAAPDGDTVPEADPWEFHFSPVDARFVRFVIHEYLGEAVAVNHVEIAGDGPDQDYIPTTADVLSLANNDVLEIAGGDRITVTYTDEFTQGNGGHSRLLQGQLTATYFNAEISPIAYDFTRDSGGRVSTQEKRLLRVDPAERLIVRIVDYDEDRTAERDTISLSISVNGGEPMQLTATETEEYSGVFTKEVDTTARVEEGKLTVKPGDRILCRYIDRQNTFPGHAVPRETIVYVNEPTEGQVRILETRMIPPPPESSASPRLVYQTPEDAEQISTVALAAPLTVEVIDPDAAKDDRSSVVVSLVTADGAKVDVRCVLSGAHRSGTGASNEIEALVEGRFLGQVVLQLGGKDSPELVPRTMAMPHGMIGGPELGDAPTERLVVRVLNVSGSDIITATYADQQRPDGDTADLQARARLVVDGQLACTDRSYENEIQQLHVGEKIFLKVTDADRDISDAPDSISVEVSTENGEREVVSLLETLTHSGVFTGSLVLKAVEQPVPGNLDADAPAIETYFGDTVRVRYVDPTSVTVPEAEEDEEPGKLERLRELAVVVGTDGVVAAFSKSFGDEVLAVETKFHVAESHFELFKSHKNLGRAEEAKADLEAGRRVLAEVMQDYPDPKYAPRVAYLAGQFAQELEQWGEAIESYTLIIRRYPDHSLAADAQYKLAQCHEEAGDFDRALEAYVTLAATYPKSPLIASVMIRISDHFYQQEKYDVAAQVAKRFLETFQGHQHAVRIAFRIGQCYYKAEKYRDAGEAFDSFTKAFADDKLAADALFWAGESYRQAKDQREAFKRYNLCRWDFPASDAAKYARGRLALPEMLRQFEADSESLNE